MNSHNTIASLILDAPIPRLEARLLLRLVTGLSATQLLTRDTTKLDDQQLTQFWSLVKRRQAGEPMAYLMGLKEFFGLDFRVNPHVLIPRPDTEILVEVVLAFAQQNPCHDLLDLGTGSGAIVISLLKSLPNICAVATDQSKDTILVAMDNAQQHGVIDRVVFVQSIQEHDWYGAIRALDRKFDIICSNPPYIHPHDEHLLGDIRFEPHRALTDGVDGLNDISRIIIDAKYFLRPDGLLVIEHGYDQGSAVRGFFESAFFKNIQTHLDLNGHERVTCGVLSSCFCL